MLLVVEEAVGAQVGQEEEHAKSPPPTNNLVVPSSSFAEVERYAGAELERLGGAIARSYVALL